MMWSPRVTTPWQDCYILLQLIQHSIGNSQIICTHQWHMDAEFDAIWLSTSCRCPAKGLYSQLIPIRQDCNWLCIDSSTEGPLLSHCQCCYHFPMKMTRVWRTRSEWYSAACVMERDRWRGSSTMVWRGICLNQTFWPVLFLRARFFNTMTNFWIPKVCPILRDTYISSSNMTTADPTLPEPPDTSFSSTSEPVSWPVLNLDLNPVNTYWTRSKENDRKSI